MALRSLIPELRPLVLRSAAGECKTGWAGIYCEQCAPGAFKALPGPQRYVKSNGIWAICGGFGLLS